MFRNTGQFTKNAAREVSFFNFGSVTKTVLIIHLLFQVWFGLGMGKCLSLYGISCGALWVDGFLCWMLLGRLTLGSISYQDGHIASQLGDQLKGMKDIHTTIKAHYPPITVSCTRFIAMWPICITFRHIQPRLVSSSQMLVRDIFFRMVCCHYYSI